MSYEHKTFSMRLTAHLLERIDHNANRAGLTRTAYVLSFLPESYDLHGDSAETGQQAARSEDR